MPAKTFTKGGRSVTTSLLSEQVQLSSTGWAEQKAPIAQEAPESPAPEPEAPQPATEPEPDPEPVPAEDHASSDDEDDFSEYVTD